MHSRSSNIKFLSYNDVNKVADELIESLRSRYQRNLERSVTGHDFNFDSVQLLRYKCHKTNLKSLSINHIFIWFIDSPGWIEKKKRTKMSEKYR